MWLSPGARLTQIARMLKSALLALSVLLALPAAGPAAAQSGRTIDIVNDSGGNVLATINRRNELQRSGRPVRIRGYCRSACTIYLTLPNACLGRNARVGFHAPRLPGTRIIPPLVGDLMGQFYRGEIRQRWYAEWQYSLDMHILSAAQYSRMDPQIRICGSGSRRKG